jgi:hypothetical protein
MLFAKVGKNDLTDMFYYLDFLPTDKFYLLTSVFVEYDERVEVGGKAS